MRIGIELKHLNPVKGGAEAYTTQLAKWLISSGHEIHLLVHDVAAPLEGAVVHRVSPFSTSAITRKVQSLKLDSFIGTDRAVGMDVFHPHRGTIRGNQEQEIARIGSKPIREIVRAASHINPRYHSALFLERRQIGDGRNGTVVIAVSEMIANEFREEFGLIADRLRVIHNGVDGNRFSETYRLTHRREERGRLGIADDDICYLLVANDFARKGVAQFIRATSVALGQEPRIRSVVVGRPDPRSYERLASRCLCAERISFLPAIQDVRTAYAIADVFVLPTWYDPCSLTVLEAWACGLPVITTVFNGASELMEDRQEGYSIADPRDIRALADRMVLLTKAERRLTMGRLGRSLAERHPLERNFRKVLEIAASQAGHSV